MLSEFNLQLTCMTEKRPKLDKLATLHCTQHRLLAGEEFIRLYTTSHTSTVYRPIQWFVHASAQRLPASGHDISLTAHSLKFARQNIRQTLRSCGLAYCCIADSELLCLSFIYTYCNSSSLSRGVTKEEGQTAPGNTLQRVTPEWNQ